MKEGTLFKLRNNLIIPSMTLKCRRKQSVGIESNSCSNRWVKISDQRQKISYSESSKFTTLLLQQGPGPWAVRKILVFLKGY